MPTPAILLYADSHNADVLYFGRVHVPDAFIAIAHGKRKIAVINALEFGRVKKDSAFNTVLPLEKYLAAAREKNPGQKVGAAEVIAVGSSGAGGGGGLVVSVAAGSVIGSPRHGLWAGREVGWAGPVAPIDDGHGRWGGRDEAAGLVETVG